MNKIKRVRIIQGSIVLSIIILFSIALAQPFKIVHYIPPILILVAFMLRIFSTENLIPPNDKDKAFLDAQMKEMGYIQAEGKIFIENSVKTEIVLDPKTGYVEDVLGHVGNKVVSIATPNNKVQGIAFLSYLTWNEVGRYRMAVLGEFALLEPHMLPNRYLIYKKI